MPEREPALLSSRKQQGTYARAKCSLSDMITFGKGFTFIQVSLLRVKSR
jgi:hypothetical protein